MFSNSYVEIDALNAPVTTECGRLPWPRRRRVPAYVRADQRRGVVSESLRFWGSSEVPRRRDRLLPPPPRCRRGRPSSSWPHVQRHDILAVVGGLHDGPLGPDVPPFEAPNQKRAAQSAGRPPRLRPGSRSDQSTHERRTSMAAGDFSRPGYPPMPGSAGS